ncbi:solute carrier family 22 member 15-like isoform X2 [Corticium candelabrum]|uniref:solute carrier family 22 member 15-like isoform X2 n=1 Tax=Corticium candelabrum TaxID=121492 RepID=UPI002E269378|nr:solute carrier family 22 member 15-like isoform X2 [Corticium candelabrum]
MGFDEVYGQIGQFGAYQRRVLIFLSIICMSAGFYAFFPVFGDTEPQAWFCRGTEDQTDKGMNEDEKCKLWSNGGCLPNYQAERESTVTEWNLICHDHWKKGLPVSAMFVGVGVGSWLSGYLSDCFGRRLVALWSFALATLACFLTAFTWSLMTYTIARFIQGVVAAGLVPVPFVLIGELVGASTREMCGNVLQAMFAVGMLILCGLALMIKNWRTLAIVCSLLASISIPILWRQIPESPRWLLLQGRKSECDQLLKLIAVTNGASGVDIDVDSTETNNSNGGEQLKDGVVDLFKNSVMRRRIIVMLLYWFAASLNYYGLSMNASVGSNMYVSFFCASIVEFPSYIASSWLLRLQGRRKSTAFFTALGCLSLLVCVFLVSGNVSRDSTLLSFSMLAKFGLGSTFANLYVYGGELAPTSVRNMTIGILSIGARVGGVVLPFVMMLDKISKSLPYAVFGVSALLALLAGLLLPETMNKELPQTLDDLLDD